MPLSFYGAAMSGMQAEQLSLDVIANNLANVNTPGFQSSRVDFQDLLYRQLALAQQLNAGPDLNAPYAVRLGQGVRPELITRELTQGTLMSDGDPLHLAISGEGYFALQLPDGTAAYSRNGAFKLDANRRLVTDDGNYVLPHVTIPPEVHDLTITADGLIYGHVGNDRQVVQVGEVQLARFNNPLGLLSIGHNLLRATTDSGPATMSVPGSNGAGLVASGFLESSNVDVATELTAMMLAERAYQLNTRSLQAVDQMLAMANNLRT